MSYVQSSLSRRSFLAAAVTTPFVAALSAATRPMVGLELFSVRQDLAKDLFGTVRTVAKTGYEAVEFFSPYYQWEPSYARQVRQLLDDVDVLRIRDRSCGGGRIPWPGDHDGLRSDRRWRRRDRSTCGSICTR